MPAPARDSGSGGIGAPLPTSSCTIGLDICFGALMTGRTLFLLLPLRRESRLLRSSDILRRLDDSQFVDDSVSYWGYVESYLLPSSLVLPATSQALCRRWARLCERPTIFRRRVASHAGHFVPSASSRWRRHINIPTSPSRDQPVAQSKYRTRHRPSKKIDSTISWAKFSLLTIYPWAKQTALSVSEPSYICILALCSWHLTWILISASHLYCQNGLDIDDSDGIYRNCCHRHHWYVAQPPIDPSPGRGRIG